MLDILLVEDDPDIVRVVCTYFENEGYTVQIASSGWKGLKAALDKPPSLIILDWMLPNLNGLEVLKKLRQEQQTPVIMLTAKGEEEDKLTIFGAGADDYVPKPFSPRELVARAKAVLKRQQGNTGDVVRVGEIEIDNTKRIIKRNGQELELTSREFDLIYILASQSGRVFRRDELLEKIWGRDFFGVDRVVDVHISNLRQKIEIDPSKPQYLHTIRRVGYVFKDYES